MDDNGREALADVDREIRENMKGWSRQKKERWQREHPRTAALTQGWGKALKKEGKALGRQLAHEGRTTVEFFGDELGRFFFGR